MNLSASKLGKRYYGGEWGLRPAELHFGPGMHGLLGPNGAGKTTLMRLLAGLLRPTTGRAELDGLDVIHPRQRQRIGYVPQTFQMYPSLTGREWLMHRVQSSPGKLFPSRRQALEQVEKILLDVNLTSQADRPARTYSTGMMKRLGIAQAMIINPDVIIVDEPTAGLDPEERLRLRNVLAEASLTRIVLLSTHILSDIEASCGSVLVLKEGTAAYQGSLAGLASFGEGKVWTWEAAQDEWRRYGPSRLMSARRTEEGFICRTLAEEPPNRYARLSEPTLEDGYMALIGLPSEGGAFL
ncbi:ATP-binding cassette domain-containing protein [Paenibacillus sambharensis]|nr:ATP-binding cassette domain-containing protein [Paenibacillus sambharensis]